MCRKEVVYDGRHDVASFSLGKGEIILPKTWKLRSTGHMQRLDDERLTPARITITSDKRLSLVKKLFFQAGSSFIQRSLATSNRNGPVFPWVSPISWSLCSVRTSWVKNACGKFWPQRAELKQQQKILPYWEF
ncbi:MAG: hypothetical protein IT427_05010 [Pirellulales bacterium]|nr:hypothetical protein [Pirellulales bacterium]